MIWMKRIKSDTLYAKKCLFLLQRKNYNQQILWQYIVCLEFLYCKQEGNSRKPDGSICILGNYLRNVSFYWVTKILLKGIVL